MIVLDTHVWLWWVGEKPRALSGKAQKAIDDDPDRCISAISFWEVAMLVRAGRISLDLPADSWLLEAVAVSGTQVLDVTAAMAAAAGMWDDHLLPGDPADRLIVATAWSHRATLITKDRRLRDQSIVQTIW